MLDSVILLIEHYHLLGTTNNTTILLFAGYQSQKFADGCHSWQIQIKIFICLDLS